MKGPTAHPQRKGIQEFLMPVLRPSQLESFYPQISTHYVQNDSIYVKENPLALGKKAEKDLNGELPTSEIQTDQPSNIMIKCLFIFFKYQIFFTHNLLINSPPILKKIKKRIKCVLLWAEPHPIDDTPTPLFSRL